MDQSYETALPASTGIVLTKRRQAYDLGAGFEILE
jgi:hypothetical protein